MTKYPHHIRCPLCNAYLVNSSKDGAYFNCVKSKTHYIDNSYRLHFKFQVSEEIETIHIIKPPFWIIQTRDNLNPTAAKLYSLTEAQWKFSDFIDYTSKFIADLSENIDLENMIKLIEKLETYKILL